MSLLQEITDKGATTSWCPIKNRSSIALGSKDGGGGQSQTFEDYGGELAIYSLDYSKSEPKLMGKTETSSRFISLGWGAKGPSGLGIVAGGMQTGVISVWDPAKLGQPLANIPKHKSQVNSLQFNPHSGTENLLASGGSDNEVYILDLNKPESPNVYSPGGPGCQKHTSEVRTVAWNTQVAHVLGTASLDGACTVWTLKAKKPWAEIRDPSGSGFSAIAWSPSQVSHLLTASVSDRDPVLRLWDVRSSTTNPLAEYRGHTAGIFSVSWCPTDPTYVISCAKDNRTLFWDLYSGKAVYELPGSSTKDEDGVGNGYANGGFGGPGGFGGGAPSQDNNVFGGRSSGLGGGTSGRRYQVQFSPHDRTVFSACSFDRKVQVYSINGGGVGASRVAATSNPPQVLRAPSWTKKPCGGAFGFGGHFVHFGTPDKKNPTFDFRRVRLSVVTDDQELSQQCADWDNQLCQALQMDVQVQQSNPTQNPLPYPNLINLCLQKAQSATTRAEREAWGFMRIPFESEARDKILQQLGFDMTAISSLVSSLDKRPQQQPVEQQQQQQQQEAPPMSPPQPQQNFANNSVFESMNGSGNELNAFDDFDSSEAAGAAVEQQNEEPPAPAVETEKKEEQPAVEKTVRSMKDVCLDDVEVVDTKVDEIVNKALLLGNFSVAVDCCLENNRFADAILLASCGGNDMWNDTIQKYLERFYNKKAYVPIVSAVIKSDLSTYVQRCDLTEDRWKEVLAIVSQYGKSEEVPNLCEILAGRLEQERSDEDASIAACLCYICAKNVAKTVDIFVKQGLVQASQVTGGGVKLSQSIVEKTSVYQHALPNSTSQFSLPNVMEHYINYAEALAGQGMLEYSAKYVSELDTTLITPEPPTISYDSMGNPTEIQTPLSEFEEKHNEQAQRALELCDRIYGAHSNPQVGLAQYIPNRPVAFQPQELRVAPSNTPYDPSNAGMQNYPSQASGTQQEFGGAGAAPGYGQAPAHPQPNQGSYGAPQQQQAQYGQQPQYGSSPQQQPYGGGQQQSQFNAYGNSPAQPTPQPVPQPQFNTPALQQNYSSGGGGYGQPQQPQPQSFQTPTPAYGQSAPPAAAAAAPTARPAAKAYVKENDGFGSTAGNPSKGQKYGNLPPGAAQPYAASVPHQSNQPGVWNPNQQPHAPQQQPQAQAPTQAPAVPKVMPPQMGPTMQKLENHMQHLGTTLQSAVEKQKLQQGLTCVATLKDKLMTGGVEDSLYPEITQLVNCIVNGDYQGATNVRQSLVSRPQVWADQKAWLKGMSSLTVLSRR